MPGGVILDMHRTGVRVPLSVSPEFEDALDGSPSVFRIPHRYRNIYNQLVGFGYIPPILPNVESYHVRRFGGGSASISSGPGIATSSNSSTQVDNVLALTGFALYNQTTESLKEMMDRNTLQQVYDRALRLLFASFVATSMVDGDSKQSVYVIREVAKWDWSINILWARAAQASLALVAIMIAVLAVLLRRRPCNLDGEPDSIAAALRVLAASPELVTELENAEFNDLDALLRQLDPELAASRGPDVAPEKLDVGTSPQFVLHVESGYGPRIQIVDHHNHMRLMPPDAIPQVFREDSIKYLRRGFGACFVLVIAVVTAILVAAYVIGEEGRDLKTPLAVDRLNSLHSTVPRTSLLTRT